jgi:hypothetical protein
LIGGLYDGAFALLLTLGPFEGGDIQTTFFVCLQVLGTCIITIWVLGLQLKTVYSFTLWQPYSMSGKIIVLCTCLISMQWPMWLFFRYTFRYTLLMAVSIGVGICLIIICQLTHFTFRDFSDEQEVLKFKKEIDDFHYDTRVR